jgi:murein DD-endopeptidase MepM/ murein hydrolase activator NlpD
MAIQRHHLAAALFAACLPFFVDDATAAEPRFFPLSANTPAGGQILPGDGGRFLPLADARRQATGGIRTDRRFLGLESVPRATVVAAAFAPPPAPIVTAMPTAVHEGAQAWPVADVAGTRISSPYGWRDDPFTGERAFHGGLDIAAPAGTAVLATADGTVRAIGEHPRLGKYVMLRFPDGSEATYGHLESIAVASGQKVVRGETLGGVGSSGRSTGPHLDYRVKVNGEHIDPLPHLRMTP